MIFEDFLTLSYVRTFLGTVVVTMLTVQFLKELPGIKKMPTKYLTFLIALINIIVSSALTGTLTMESLYLIFINAMLVTFTSTGGYDFTIKSIKINQGAELIPQKVILPEGETTEIR